MTLDQEFEFYKSNQTDLATKYRGKFLVIKNGAVAGVFDTQIEAYSDGQAKFGLGNFLLQECLPVDENPTQTFHSRVAFSG